MESDEGARSACRRVSRPWWWTSITGASPDEDLFGRRVRVAFEKVGDGETIPYFTVIEETNDERR